GGEDAEGGGADHVGADHQRAPVEAVGGEAGGEAEQDDRRELDRADVAGLRGRVRDDEREERIRDPRDARAEGREQLPRLEQHEVAVAPERGRLHRARRARSTLPERRYGGGCERRNQSAYTAAAVMSTASQSQFGEKPRTLGSSREAQPRSTICSVQPSFAMFAAPKASRSARNARAAREAGRRDTSSAVTTSSSPCSPWWTPWWTAGCGASWNLTSFPVWKIRPSSGTPSR